MEHMVKEDEDQVNHVLWIGTQKAQSCDERDWRFAHRDFWLRSSLLTGPVGAQCP